MATSDSRGKSGIAAFASRRTLEVYPVGRHRWAMLGLTVLATILAAFEFQLAPVLPLLLPYLHMSKLAYGTFISFAVLVSAVSAFIGGPLADRYGRVALIDICLAITTAFTFLNIAITGFWSFAIVRTMMALVGGLMAGAGAALVRDMSPRLSRALAFGLLSFGPVGSNWLANFIAGASLPIFHTWQSQFWIMGTLGLAMYIPVVLWLKDLSPDLRLRIFETERAAIAASMPSRAVVQMPRNAREAFGNVLNHYQVWLLVIGVNASLMLYIAIQAFGPLMFTELFHYTPAEAARVSAYFWLMNLALLVVTGLISDRMQIRKPIAILGGIAVIVLMSLWIPTFGRNVPHATTTLFASLLGSALAICYVPWAAQYSEVLEDISPALQATGWAFYGLVTRGWVAISVPMMLIVAARFGWERWMWASLWGMSIYVIAMVLVQGRWMPASGAEQQPATSALPAA
jgi:OPA family glycerol-3-phosphate transporter-like MFS transporter